MPNEKTPDPTPEPKRRQGRPRRARPAVRLDALVDADVYAVLLADRDAAGSYSAALRQWARTVHPEASLAPE